MKIIIVLVILMVLAVWSPAYGRIGETIEECIVRYGEIDSESEIEGRTAHIFKKSGYIIAISFYEKKADMMLLFKEEKDDLGFNVEISDNEIAILLKSNGGDTPWEPLEIVSLNKQWVNNDKRLLSIYMYPGNTLTISTLDCVSRMLAKEKTEEEKSLDGF
jgi:hypothetical protein